MNISFIIPGPPSRTTHQSGTRNTKGGKTYKNEALRNEERKLYDVFEQFVSRNPGLFPINNPIEVSYKFYFETLSKIKDERKTTKPDWDNLPKTIQDIMTRCGIISDDAIIWKGSCEKYNVAEGLGKIEITIKTKKYE